MAFSNSHSNLSSRTLTPILDYSGVYEKCSQLLNDQTSLRVPRAYTFQRFFCGTLILGKLQFDFFYFQTVRI